MRRIVAGNKMFSVERDCETKPLLLHITIHKLYLLDWGVTRGESATVTSQALKYDDITFYQHVAFLCNVL